MLDAEGKGHSILFCNNWSMQHLHIFYIYITYNTRLTVNTALMLHIHVCIILVLGTVCIISIGGGTCLLNNIYNIKLQESKMGQNTSYINLSLAGCRNASNPCTVFSPFVHNLLDLDILHNTSQYIIVHTPSTISSYDINPLLFALSLPAHNHLNT